MSLYINGERYDVAPNILAPMTIIKSALGATPADAITLKNLTDAAAGAQQYSPALRLHGEGWKTDATAASQNVDWRVYAQPVQGAANPTVNLLFQSSINDGAFSLKLSLTSDGRLRVNAPSGAAVYFNLDFAEVVKFQIAHNNTDTFLDWEGILNFRTGVEGSILASFTTTGFAAPSADSAVLQLQAKDNGVGLVEIARLVGAVDPYFQIGRDDTGVALNAVTDMLVLQAGGGTGNEAANFGLGISLKIGNAASQMEERGSIDLVLVTATDAAEDARLDFNTMQAGAMANRGYIGNGLVMGAPTGGDKGLGTINATAVYDDNVLLTDWVFDKHYGRALSPGLLAYKGARLWSLADTRLSVEEQHRLPWMPTWVEVEAKRSLGEMVTRLWEGQEHQQLHAFILEDRIAALEKLTGLEQNPNRCLRHE